VEYCEECENCLPGDNIEFARCKKVPLKEDNRRRIAAKFHLKFEYCIVCRTEDTCKNFDEKMPF